MKFTPQEIHEIKLTLAWLEKETPEQWAVGVRYDGRLKQYCIVGHLDRMPACNRTLLDKLVIELPEAQRFASQGPGVHCLNNNLGGNKRKILDVLWGLLKEAQ